MGITRYLGLGKETEVGTIATATVFIDPESISLDPTGGSLQVYKGISGQDNIVAQGSYTSGGNFSFPMDDKAVGHLLKWAFGTVDTTGASAPYTHVFSPSTTPLMQTFTAHVGKDVFEHIFAGCAISKMSFSAQPNGFLIAQFDLVGGRDSKGALSGSPTYTTGTFVSAPDITVSIDGEDASAKVESFKLDINLGADNEGGITLGSRYPKKVYRGGLDVALDLTLGFTDTAELERFWGGASGPMATVNEFAININAGSNIDFIIPRAVYTAMGQPVAGRDRIIQSGKVTALRSADGATAPIQISLTNSQPTY